MIPLEYENLKTWIRINNRIQCNMQKEMRKGDVWLSGYLAGGRDVLRHLSKQWAHDIIARRKYETNSGRRG